MATDFKILRSSRSTEIKTKKDSKIRQKIVKLYCPSSSLDGVTSSWSEVVFSLVVFSSMSFLAKIYSGSDVWGHQTKLPNSLFLLPIVICTFLLQGTQELLFCYLTSLIRFLHKNVSRSFVINSLIDFERIKISNWELYWPWSSLSKNLWFLLLLL